MVIITDMIIIMVIIIILTSIMVAITMWTIITNHTMTTNMVFMPMVMAMVAMEIQVLCITKYLNIGMATIPRDLTMWTFLGRVINIIRIMSAQSIMDKFIMERKENIYVPLLFVVCSTFI